MPRPNDKPSRRTRVVATVGPASREPAVLGELIAAGVDVFRLNLSHGSHEEHAENYRRIRAAAEAAGESVAVLADLCGPKVRVGRFPGGQITLTAGETVAVTTRDVPGAAGLIPSRYAELARDVRPGDRILLDDGLLELRVESTDGTDAACRVKVGGVLRDRKGMNLPGVAVSSPALTEQDRRDASFALGLGVDYLALSFVRRPRDVRELKTLIRDAGTARTPVIAKIEKPEAMNCIDEILVEADGLMVARGDLGVEMPPEAVPIVQRDLIERARRASKPVIVATQMLESMVHNPRPTRAEVSDVSTAVFAGADAVMLSAETSVGAYPVQAAAMMDRVAGQTEAWQSLDSSFAALTEEDAQLRPLSLRQAVARSLAQLSRDLRVRAVVVRTQNGISAAVVAATRPAAPVVALTMDPAVARRLKLIWGVEPRVVADTEFAQPQAAARRHTVELGLAEPGQAVLLLSGFGKNQPKIIVLTV